MSEQPDLGKHWCLEVDVGANVGEKLSDDVDRLAAIGTQVGIDEAQGS